jgi:hypothetical protein
LVDVLKEVVLGAEGECGVERGDGTAASGEVEEVAVPVDEQ